MTGNSADRILLCGTGGREHALVSKALQSPRVAHCVWVGPGLSAHWGAEQLRSQHGARLEIWDRRLDVSQFEVLAEDAVRARITLAVIGPDALLADGITDVLHGRGIAVMGPTRQASELEWSKAFAKDVLKNAGVPTAQSRVFDSVQAARTWIESQLDVAFPLVVKLDGLFLGKGVAVCTTKSQALLALDSWAGLSAEGAARAVLIEEFLQGEEISWLALCDGKQARLYPPARDYKRLIGPSAGPNTGGMGSYVPIKEAERALGYERIEREVFAPVLAEMKRLGRPYRGVLYAGLMWDRRRDRFWVLEFNARYGDPETQALVAHSTRDWLDDWTTVARGQWSRDQGVALESVGVATRSTVYWVLAAPGYPDAAEPGGILQAPLESSKTIQTFISGLQSDGRISGGRILGVAATAPSLVQARSKARLAHQAWIDATPDATLRERLLWRKDVAAEPTWVILASGRGSNARALLRAYQTGQIAGECVGVVSDQATAGVRDVAAEFQVPFVVVERARDLKGITARHEHESRMQEALRDLCSGSLPDLVVLAGYERLLTPSFIQSFWDAGTQHSRILNIHPSLLPEFPGLHSYQQAWDANVSHTGVTVHWVDAGVDTGPILEQQKFEIERTTVQNLEAAGLAVEHVLYPTIVDRELQRLKEQDLCF